MTSHYRIVVGMDLDKPGDQALRTALDLAGRTTEGADVHVVHVLAPRVDNDLAAATKALEEASASIAGRVRAIEGPRDHLAIRVHVRYGDVLETMRQLCVDYDADVLVVGTHGRTGAARLVLGSIAQALVQSAPLPVIVAHEKDFAGLTRSVIEAATPGQPLKGDQSVSEAIWIGPRVAHVSGLI